MKHHLCTTLVALTLAATALPAPAQEIRGAYAIFDNKMTGLDLVLTDCRAREYPHDCFLDIHRGNKSDFPPLWKEAKALQARKGGDILFVYYTDYRCIGHVQFLIVKGVNELLAMTQASPVNTQFCN